MIATSAFCSISWFSLKTSPITTRKDLLLRWSGKIEQSAKRELNSKHGPTVADALRDLSIALARLANTLDKPSPH